METWKYNSLLLGNLKTDTTPPIERIGAMKEVDYEVNARALDNGAFQERVETRESRSKHGR